MAITDDEYGLMAAKQERIEMSLAKQLQRSIETNNQLRMGLRKAADRFEAKGLHSDAFECRRLLREL